MENNDNNLQDSFNTFRTGRVADNSIESIKKQQMAETDSDLMTACEIVKLPSNGFNPLGLKEIEIEYLTAKDEDILTTPSLIESGKVLNIILRRKIKTPNVNINDLLIGDKNAIWLFLRASSYGEIYPVMVTDPQTGKEFKADVDLRKFNYKVIKEKPSERGTYFVSIPMRKKNIEFRILTSGEEEAIAKNAESLMEAYGQEYSELTSLRLKSQIVSVDGNADKLYINRFVDALPALDSLTIRRKIMEVTPDIDANYEFTSPDGHKFKTLVTFGLDFFFPWM